MSVPVDLATLRDRIAEFGAHPYLVTVNDDGTPHVTSVTVRVVGDDLVVGTGRRTRRNLAERADASLLWPPAADPAYSLIVDVTGRLAGDDEGGEGGDEDAVLAPRAAILHRVAGAAGDGPNCVPLDEASAP